MIANEHTAEAEEKRQPQIAYIKEASAKLKALLNSVSDKEAKRRVERAYDALYSSPVKSHPDLERKERQIFQYINDLEREVSTGNKDGIIATADLLLVSINERNSLLKSLN